MHTCSTSIRCHLLLTTPVECVCVCVWGGGGGGYQGHGNQSPHCCQKVPLLKPGAGGNIALNASPTARTSVCLIPVFLWFIHLDSVLTALFRLKWRCVMNQEMDVYL